MTGGAISGEMSGKVIETFEFSGLLNIFNYLIIVHIYGFNAPFYVYVPVFHTFKGHGNETLFKNLVYNSAPHRSLGIQYCTVF